MGGARHCYGARIPPALSLTGKRWTDDGLPALAAEEVLAFLAEKRGLADLLTGTRPALSAPSLFADMGRCTDRILSAMREGETVAVFGDYDADGITAAAQLKRFFLRHGTTPYVHLPHREREGYGLKPASVDACHGAGATLIITVDTGISSHEAIAHAAARGIDVIVTDHHTPLRGAPDAFAVIHPQVPSPFPNPHLSGAGVALLLVHALEEALRSGNDAGQWNGVEEDVVLATIGTVADLVPLVGENRTLVQHGLALIPRLLPGALRSFITHTLAEERVTGTDIAFRIAPQINASGRLAHPDLALQALTEGGEHIAALSELNEKRKALTRDLFAVAEGMVDVTQTFLCVASEAFPAGIVGLLAGKLTERYGRPSLAASIRDGVCTASMRSTEAVALTDVLKEERVRSLLLAFGGHAQAAGCTFAEEHFADLTRALNAEMDVRELKTSDLLPTLPLAAEITADALHEGFARTLRTLEPFGNGNAEPTFLLRGVMLSDARTVGADGAHLQCKIRGAKCIGFGMGAFLAHCSSPVDIACTVSVRHWNGREETQVHIKDLRVHHSTGMRPEEAEHASVLRT